MTDYILTLSCAKRAGIVAAVAKAIAQCGGNITEAAQFDDALIGQFFMRVAFATDASKTDVETALSNPIDEFAIKF